METKDNTTALVSEQAAVWHARMTADNVSDATRQSFTDWLGDNPAHGKEFAAISALWAAMDEVEASGQLKLHNEAHHQAQRRGYAFGRPAIVALAASVVIAVSVVLSLGDFGKPPTSLYITDAGETQTVSLEDGSVVHLNTQSELSWHGSKKERRAVLHRGEALFDVKPDANSPFTVEAGSGIIRVLGTRFNVYRKSDSEVVVTVLEGKVLVEDAYAETDEVTWQRNLIANQEIVYQEAGVTEEIKQAPAFEKVSWRDGILILDNLPLLEVVNELSRYSDKRIVIRDARLNKLQIGGTVGIANIEDALSFLEQVAPLEVSESYGSYILDYSNN